MKETPVRSLGGAVGQLAGGVGWSFAAAVSLKDGCGEVTAEARGEDGVGAGLMAWTRRCFGLQRRVIGQLHGLGQPRHGWAFAAAQAERSDD